MTPALLAALITCAPGPSPVVVHLTRATDVDPDVSLQIATELATALEARSGRRVLVDVGGPLCIDAPCLRAVAARFSTDEVVALRLVGGVSTQLLAQVASSSPRAPDVIREEIYLPVDTGPRREALAQIARAVGPPPLPAPAPALAAVSAPPPERQIPWGPALTISGGALATVFGVLVSAEAHDSARALTSGGLSAQDAEDARRKVARGRILGAASLAAGGTLVLGGLLWQWLD